VAMMIPAPVLAKSSKSGGKLVKSVTFYNADNETGSWNAYSRTTYKYDKKNNPVEVKNVSLKSYLGIPVSGGVQYMNTYKYKYKGKTPKSGKAYDGAGFVRAKRTYKGGKLATWTTDSKSSKKKLIDGKVVEYANFDATVGNATYFKNKLQKATSVRSTSLNSDNDASDYTDSTVYAWSQKKGVPSVMYATSVRTGTYTSWDEVWDDEENEWVATKKVTKSYDGTPSTRYAIFNTKGLVVESGNIVDGKNVDRVAYVYTMKKGRVDTVVKYSVDSKGNPTPLTMMKFAYTKTKISKTRNFNMINSMVGLSSDFRWY